MSFEIGQRVGTGDERGKGTVAFVGTTQFMDGEWVGVILDEKMGKNDGSVKGVRYFECEYGYGLFIRPAQLLMDSGKSVKPPASALKTPSALKKDSTRGSTSKLSPASTPRMSPAASRESLVPRTPAVLSKKQPSPSEVKAPQEKSTKKDTVVVQPDLPPATPAAQSVPLVKRRVSEMEKESPLPTPIANVPGGMDDGTQIEYLKVTIKDLNEKLETLRAKRKEDHEKLTQASRLENKLVQLNEWKRGAMERQEQLTRELAERKQESEELREWKDSKQEALQGAEYQLEMATLDKEMAEERAEQLAAETEDLRTRVQELEADLAILREELGGESPNDGNSVQFMQLQQKCELMREAIVRLRDANGNALADKQAAEREAERLREENSELTRLGELWKNKAEDLDEAMISMREQLDAFMGSDQLINHLSEKAFIMEDQIQMLQNEKEDLEALREMDEQIGEEQKEVEKVLRKELEEFQVTINELLLRQRQDEGHAETLSNTIIKFRKRTAELNAEIEDTKDQVLQLQRVLEEEREGGKERAGQASLAIVSVSRAFALSVEARLHKLEVQLSTTYTQYIKAFLPDNFSKPGGDSDCVHVVVIVPRIGSKATLLAELMKEKYPEVPGGIRAEHVTKSHKAEQWAHVAKGAYVCAGIKSVGEQIKSALDSCTGDRLASMALIHSDFALHERAIDNYINLLKDGRLDENTSLEQLESCSRYMNKKVMEEQLAARDSFDGRIWTENALDTLLAAVEWWESNERRLPFMALDESSDVVAWCKTVSAQFNAMQQGLRKAKTRLPSGDTTLVLSEVFFENLTRSLFLVHRIASLLHDTCAVAATQLAMLAGEATAFDSGRLKEMLHGVLEKAYGKTSLERVFEPVDKEASSLATSMAEVFKTIHEGTLETEVAKLPKKFPPLLERAHARKQAASEADGIRWQLEKKETELIEIKKMLKGRLDDISNYKLRLEMAEARADDSTRGNSKKESTLQASYDQLLADHKREKNAFEETMDNLTKDLRRSEEENKELKEKAKNISKKALLQNIQNQEVGATNRSPAASQGVGRGTATAEIAVLESQLEDALGALKRTSLQLRAEKGAASLVPTIHVPHSICGPFSLKNSPVDCELDAMEKEAEQLFREEGRFAFFAADANKSWRENEVNREAWLRDRQLFHFRVQSVRGRLRQYWGRIHPGEEVPRLLAVDQKKIVPAGELNMHSKTFKEICGRWGIAC